mgnify:CR=1 FL=1
MTTLRADELRAPAQLSLPFGTVRACDDGTAASVVSTVEWSVSRARVRCEFLLVGSEHARRRVLGGGALASKALLADLSTLPCDVPVPMSALSASVVGRLRLAPTFAVVERDGDLVRQAFAAVQPICGWVFAGSWAAAQPALDALAPYVQRNLVVPDSVAGDPLVLYAAERWGIGVIAADAGLVQPAEPFVVQRHSVQRWLFAERLYERWLHADRAPCVPVPVGPVRAGSAA